MLLQNGLKWPLKRWPLLAGSQSSLLPHAKRLPGNKKTEMIYEPIPAFSLFWTLIKSWTSQVRASPTWGFCHWQSKILNHQLSEFSLIWGLPLRAGVPKLPVHGLLGTGLHSRRWVVGEQVKLHLHLQPLPITLMTTWAPRPVRSAAALDSHRSWNPTVNCTWEGSRLRAPYENLMPDDLRWSWGSDAGAGERLQIQIVISREVWLHRHHKKSIACRLLSKPYQRGFPGGAVVESLPANAGDTGSSPGLGRSHMPRSNWAREPQLLSLRIWSLCPATGGAAMVRGPRTAMKSGPRLPQLQKALAQKRRPNTAKNK